MMLAQNSPMLGKRVMFIINQDMGGGVEYLARVLSTDLEKRGARCTTYFLYPASDVSTAAKLKHIAQTSAYIIKSAPDVIFAFQPSSSAVASVAGRLSGCKVRIVHQSNSPAKSHIVVREIDKILGSIGGYSVTIANSRATMAEFARYPKAYQRRIKLIEHGIPSPVYKLSPREILAKYDIPDDGPLLLMAARLDVQKGQSIIVNSLPKLPGARLAMAGSGPDKAVLMALAEKLGVAKRLNFLGHVDRQDLTDLYRAASLFVFPSAWETFGLAGVEAAMVGLPVVASDIPALREVLTVGGVSAAHFVNSRDSDVWAAAIASCLADKGLRGRSEAFATTIQHHYSEERMMQGYVELYSELMT